MLQCRPAQEFSLGPRALKDALVSTDPALRQLYASTFSPAERFFLAEAYNPRRTLFSAPLIRTAFDWLLSRPEAPEDFETFQAALQTTSSEGLVAGALLDSLRSWAEAFFLGLQVRCLPSVAAATIHCTSRPRRDSDGLQLHTDGILSFLKNSKPRDALCVLGLTLSDLYPCEAWRFTFSAFLPGHDVGVCSFARFSGDLLQGASRAPAPAQADDPAAGQAMCFSALGMVQRCKVTCHELCRLLGLGSCRWLRCVLQGALSLDEALRRPPDLCPVCLRKLQHLLGFRLLERYKRLYAWTQAVAGTWPGREAGEPSELEDTPPRSADSGLGCETDSEPSTSLSEPLTPDVWAPALAELVPEDRLGSPGAPEGPLLPAAPGEALTEHGRWLAMCIQALEREVTDEELARLDGAVDALARWEMFTGRLPAPRRDPACGRDGAGLRKALGDNLFSLRKRLSARRLSRPASAPCHGKAEDN